ncbi:MAG: molybdopterin-dependent oxidoreductase, partial [Pseudomonadota bacterium]
MDGADQPETRSTCPYCGVGCGVLLRPDGQGGLSVRGDPDHPANKGRLCSKGSALGQTVGLGHRLLAPQISGVEADWDTALSLVADKFTQTVAAHGPDSVAFYVSGQLLTEDYYVANKLMKGFIGSANIDTNSRLCMASTVAGHKRAFGTDTVPGTYEDLDEADLVVLVGSNLAWCHPVLYQRLMAARAAHGTKVIVIDPRRTATCDGADLHLPIAPGGDVALFNRLLTAIHESGAIDEGYLAHVNGFETALETASGDDANATGLSDAQIAEFCRLWIQTKKVVTVFSQGVNQSTSGSDKVNSIINCHLATGRIGKPGMGPFSVTGQPNAMGGREVGGLANMLACHLDLENADHRAAVRDFWQAPAVPDAPGLKAVDMFNAVGNGRIKALWVIHTNPAVSMPDASAVRNAIAGCPFTVVSDITARTDTARLADVVLPATAWAEKSGTVTNSDRTISRQRAVLAAPVEARADWDILAEVGRRMGFETAFDYQTPAEIFREYAALSRLSGRFGRDFDISELSDLSDQDYDALEPVRWPLAPGRSGGRFFADGGFFHPDGKARMMPVVAKPLAVALSRATPFRLNTGRLRDQWHT